jgi:lantibiotic modifying enzyme
MDHSCKNLIKNKVNLIAEALFDKPLLFPQREISLLGGKTGMTLFLALKQLYENHEDAGQDVKRQIEQSVRFIESSETLLATHCNGIAGWGWLLRFLQSNQISNQSIEDYIVEVEDISGEAINDFLAQRDYDLLHGAMGVGLFLLNGSNLSDVEKIVRSLDESCEKSDVEYKWSRYDKFVKMDHIYDFGLAHGNTGILYFLTQCYHKKVLPETCEDLIKGLLRFLFNNVQEIDATKSFFPGTIATSSYSTTNKINNYSRLAWCYGDLSMLYTMHHAASLIGLNEISEKTIHMLHRVTLRKTFDVTFVSDAALCHGTSGIAYIYLKLYQQTGDDIFKGAFEYWLNETLEMGKEENGVAGYIFDMGTDRGRRVHYDMLTGITGVGIFFLSVLCHLDGKACDWDSSIFLNTAN